MVLRTMFIMLLIILYGKLMTQMSNGLRYQMYLSFIKLFPGAHYVPDIMLGTRGDIKRRR